MIHYKIWGALEDINERVIPGKGKLVGFGKKDIFGPVDLIPVLGPINKVHKAAKLVKHGPKLVVWVAGAVWAAVDVIFLFESVEWYNARYRAVAEEIEEESSREARRGNAVGPRGGTKKKKSGNTRQSRFVRCRSTKKSGKFRGKCVREKGHLGAHFYK